MAAELAASERLNYLSKKQRAVSSRHTRLIINANNGNSFTADSVTNIQIPGGQAATYMDFQNSYLRFTVKNENNNAISMASAYDLIERLEILADGQTLSNIAHYGVLVNQYLATECGKGWLDFFGHQLAGTTSNVWGAGATATIETGDLAAVVAQNQASKIKQTLDAGGTNLTVDHNFTGALDVTNTQDIGVTLGANLNAAVAAPVTSIAKDKSQTFCLPLVLTPFYAVNKYIPLVGRSNLQIRITWATGKKGVRCGGAVDDTKIIYSPVDMIVSAVRLSADANAMVMANTGGRFELITSDFRTAQGAHNVATGNNIALNCGFSFSSLDRISFAFYPTLNDQGVYGQINRSSGNLQNYALAVNGEEYPRKRIDIANTADITSISEAIAEVGIAHRSLADFNHQSNIQNEKYYLANPDGTTYAKTGDFVAMIDTEAMQPHTGDSLYSGISTLGSVVQLVGDTLLDTQENKEQILLVFAQFTVALTLDMNGTQTWVVSI